MERNYEDKYNINLIGKTVYKIPFYILEIENKNLPAHYQKYLFARYNPIDECFYDFRLHNGSYISIKNGYELSKLEEGMIVEYSEFDIGWPEIVIPKNCIVNKELVESKQLDKKALAEKYGKKLFNEEKIVILSNIINNYCEKRLEEGKKVDPYIADIMLVLGNEMGLKIGTSGNLYCNTGFTYPEEIEKVVAGLYELLTLKFQKTKPFIKPYSIHFNENGYIPNDYYNFICQLEYVSGISHQELTPDIINLIESDVYHQRDEESIKTLKKMTPKFYFGKKESYFDENDTDVNSHKYIITREKPNYKWPFLKKINDKEKEKTKTYIK